MSASSGSSSSSTARTSAPRTRHHNGNPGTSGAEIKFAFDILRGGAAVRESGVYRTDVPVAAGDVLRIAVVGGAVKYSKNGTIFYTSSVAPTYPLLIDTSLWE